MTEESEEDALRRVALKNAESIIRARQRAERELIAAKETLEEKTRELTRSEAELRQQREWFQVTLSSIGDAVITTNTEGRVTFLNPVAEMMTAWTSREALGVPLEQVFHIVNEDTRNRVENPVNRVLQEGTIVGLANHTLLIARDGKEVAIEDSAAPIRNLEGTVVGAVMVFHDVTARRRAEEALREADRRKDDFLATLAHELRNPLAPIRQAILIAKSSEATEAQRRWCHGVIDRQVQHMSLLLEDLLDISRITRGMLALRLQPTELASVIEAAIETSRPVIDAKQHTLSIEMPPETVRFSADPLRLAQVFSNLLTNAAKYTDPEGRIRVTASLEPETIIVSVADTGIGISREALPKLFEMFSQLHSDRNRAEGGLGIGLALTKGLVGLHGGHIEARSDGLGCGSEFLVRLPRRELAEAKEEGAQHLPLWSPKSRWRVLIADDNRDAADTLAELLRLEGHEVMTVHDGADAVAAFEQFRPEVALLDIGMPGVDGHEAARRIRQTGSGAKLIAVTGWGQERDKERALSAGFDFHLTKPIDPVRLTALLHDDRADLPK